MSRIRFRSGYAKYSDLAMFLAYAGESDPFDSPTKIIVLDDARSEPEWGLEDFNDVFVDVCSFRSGAMERPAFVCISEEGKVWFHLENRVIEDIPDAGLSKPTSLKLGYVGGIRQLGGELYAYGYAGQIYRRTAPATWEHFDQGIVGAPGDDYDITGMCLSGGMFYAVTRMGGEGRIYSRDSRNGDMWMTAVNHSGEWLNAIEADQDGNVWVCGRNGALLRGNATTGFTQAGDLECDEEFLSVALFREQIWLSSVTSLYNWSEGRLSKVDTGLLPGICGAHRLQVVDDVLWSFGYDEVLRYNGDRWMRFACPCA